MWPGTLFTLPAGTCQCQTSNQDCWSKSISSDRRMPVPMTSDCPHMVNGTRPFFLCDFFLRRPCLRWKRWLKQVCMEGCVKMPLTNLLCCWRHQKRQGCRKWWSSRLQSPYGQRSVCRWWVDRMESLWLGRHTNNLWLWLQSCTPNWNAYNGWARAWPSFRYGWLNYMIIILNYIYIIY